MDKNQAIVSGRIVRDALVYDTRNGSKMVMFSIATGSSKKDANGNWEKGNSNFISCKAFGTVAENLAPIAKKGTKIEVMGPIVTGRYTNKNGVEVFTTDIRVAKFETDQVVNKPKAAQSSWDAFASENLEPLYSDSTDTDCPF